MSTEKTSPTRTDGTQRDIALSLYPKVFNPREKSELSIEGLWLYEPLRHCTS